MISINPKVICGTNNAVVNIVPTSEQITLSSKSFFTVGAGYTTDADKTFYTSSGVARSNVNLNDTIRNIVPNDIVSQTVKWKVNALVGNNTNNFIKLHFGNNVNQVPHLSFVGDEVTFFDETVSDITAITYAIGDEYELRGTINRDDDEVKYEFFKNGVKVAEHIHAAGVTAITQVGNTNFGTIYVANGTNVGTYNGFTFEYVYNRRIADAPNGYTINGSSTLSTSGTTANAPTQSTNLTLNNSSGNRQTVVFSLNDGSAPPEPVEVYLNPSATVEISGPNVMELGKPYVFTSNHPLNWEGAKNGNFVSDTEGKSGVVFVPTVVGPVTLTGTSVCNPSLQDSFTANVIEASDSIGETPEARTSNFYVNNQLANRSGRDSTLTRILGACDEITVKANPLWHPFLFIDKQQGRIYNAKFNGVKFTDIIIDDDNYFVNKAENYVGKYNGTFSFASRNNVSDSLSVTYNYNSGTSLDTKLIPAESTFGFRFGSFGAGFFLSGTTSNQGVVNILQYSIETFSGTYLSNTNLTLNANHAFEVRLNKTLGRIEFVVDNVVVFTEIVNALIQQMTGDGNQSVDYNGNAYTDGLDHISAVEGGEAKFQATVIGNTSVLTVQRAKADLLIVGNPVAGQVGKKYTLTNAPAGSFYGINGVLNAQIDNDYNPVAPKAVFTPTAEGDVDLTFTTENGCVVHINQSELTDIEEFRVYGAMTFTPVLDAENECVIAKQGEEFALVVSGGSGDFTYKVSGGNAISQAGLVQVIGSESFNITVTDNLTNVELSIPVCVEFNSVCVAPTETEAQLSEPEACCDVVMECNEGGQILQAPSFLIDQPRNDNHNQIPVVIGNGVNISEQFAEITSQVANATANVLPKSIAGDSFFFRIVSQLGLLDVNAGEIRFDFKGSETAEATSLVFFTDNITRKVKIENDGVLEIGSTFDVVKGREFAYGFNTKTKKFELYVNNIRRFTSEAAPTHCGILSLSVRFANAGVTIGGAVKFDSLSNKTNLGGLVIQSENKYVPPASGFDGVEILEAIAGEFRKEVLIRVIQPIVMKTKKNAFQFGVTANVFIGPPRSTRDKIRLSKKGVPDAAQNPCMTWMGKTKNGVTVTFSTETQKDKADDLTVLKWITDALARVEFDMLNVNDLDLTSKISNGMIKRISENHYGIGLPDYVEPFRVLIVYQIGGKGSNTYRVIELSNSNSENELSMAISNQGERAAASVVIEATPDDSKLDVNSIGDIWTIQDCRYSNSNPACSVG